MRLNSGSHMVPLLGGRVVVDRSKHGGWTSEVRIILRNRRGTVKNEQLEKGRAYFREEKADRAFKTSQMFLLLF